MTDTIRTTLLLACAFALGCDSFAPMDHRPDLAPGVDYSIRVEGTDLYPWDEYDGPYIVAGDGVTCDYAIDIDDTGVTVGIACDASAASVGLLPSRIVNIDDANGITIARVILDARG